MKFNKNELEIIERCKKKKACKTEFTKLINSKNSKEFWKVINNNLDWVLTNKIITDKDYFNVDREELYLTITNDLYKYLYCKNVNDRKELYLTITNDWYKYLYCKYVKDRKELYLTITNDKYKYFYCQNVKDREELNNYRKF